MQSPQEQDKGVVEQLEELSVRDIEVRDGRPLVEIDDVLKVMAAQRVEVIEEVRQYLENEALLYPAIDTALQKLFTHS